MSKMTSEGRRACFFAFGEAAETEEKRRGDGSDSAGVKLNLEVEVSSQGLAKGYRKLSFRSYSPSRLMLTRAFPLVAIRCVPTKPEFGLFLTLNQICRR